MISRRRFAAQLAASAFAPSLAGRAARAQPSPAQGWPNRFVRVVVPYASGGPTDAVARTVADPLAKTWGQQVVIENKGGAGSNIGAEVVARSDPDGYTLLVGSSALSMNRNLYRSLNYD
ncbi:MAG TPA: tripartite tricarboxylate transporter substrate-binding protein, partial [Xanthobacteraceae bacterium]|nr:tripartite tricarboxylate transporter substrate-binding protein [Xanthobacteraceae bacterium]